MKTLPSRLIVLVGALVSMRAGLAYAQVDLSRGIRAFEARRWSDAMDSFLETLRQDPTNTQAHAYINLIARELETERQAIVREHRLHLLADAAKEVNGQEQAALQQAILNTTQSEKNARDELWRSRCEEARMQRENGHLLSANDIVLQVLAENPSYPDAQRELSELQSQIRLTLDSGVSPSIGERFALEGFYAFGQADYPAALVAWGKAKTMMEQSYPGTEGKSRLNDLHFTGYAKIAQAHVDEEERVAALKTLFDEGVALFHGRHFTQALEAFRKLAIREPEYPQLGYYLVQAESAAERERSERLGEEKRREIDRALRSGLAALEKEQLLEAEQHFKTVLRFDPSHPQAHSYLTMVRAEMQKRHDPKAAQMHYEAGLIAYASGKLDDAMREWHMATRMNPEHEKALNALVKVQKELALNNQAGMNETIP